MRFTFYLCLVLCAAASCASPVCQADSTVDPPAIRRAAVVNGTPITAEAFEQELKRLQRLQQREGRPAEAASRKQALENLIVRQLLYQEAVRAGIRVPEKEVSSKLTELRRGLASPVALEDTLESMGLSTGDLEAQLGQGLVIERYLAGKFSKGAAVSDEEVRHYYEDHQDEFKEPLRLRLSHILVKIDPAWDESRKEQGRARIRALALRVAKGEDFAALAREASECYSAKNGGDLGYFLPGQLSRMIEDEARLLKPGEVSGMVQDRYGLHLLKLTELRPAGTQPLDQVRERIQARLNLEKELKMLAPLVKRLRAAGQVELLLNEDER